MRLEGLEEEDIPGGCRKLDRWESVDSPRAIFSQLGKRDRGSEELLPSLGIESIGGRKGHKCHSVDQV
jgi:hypothetical protein